MYIKRRSALGLGASIAGCFEIGENVIVVAGALVTKNIPNDFIVYGVPAIGHK